MRWASSWTRRPPGPMASSGSSFWIRCGRTWYVTWYCLVYQLHFYVVTMSKILKENSTVFSRIGDTNKLSAFFPCKPLTLAGGSLSCLRLFTSSKLTKLARQKLCVGPSTYCMKKCLAMSKNFSSSLLLPSSFSQFIVG